MSWNELVAAIKLKYDESNFKRMKKSKSNIHINTINMQWDETHGRLSDEVKGDGVEKTRNNELSIF